MMAKNYSFGIERDEKKLEINDRDPTKWSNPLEARYYCFLCEQEVKVMQTILADCLMHRL